MGARTKGETFISRPPGQLEGGGGGGVHSWTTRPVPGGGWGRLKRRGRSSFQDHQDVQGGGREGKKFIPGPPGCTGWASAKGKSSFRDHQACTGGESEGEKFIPRPPGLYRGRERRGEVHSETTRPASPRHTARGDGVKANKKGVPARSLPPSPRHALFMTGLPAAPDKIMLQ